jgi:hypothetical protein
MIRQRHTAFACAGALDCHATHCQWSRRAWRASYHYRYAVARSMHSCLSHCQPQSWRFIALSYRWQHRQRWMVARHSVQYLNQNYATRHGGVHLWRYEAAACCMLTGKCLSDLAVARPLNEVIRSCLSHQQQHCNTIYSVQTIVPHLNTEKKIPRLAQHQAASSMSCCSSFWCLQGTSPLCQFNWCLAEKFHVVACSGSCL